MNSARLSRYTLNAVEIVVVLVRPQGPVNLGLTARACANMGVPALRLVDPLTEVDQPDARKFANHAKESLLAAAHFDCVRDAVADCDCVVGTSAHRRQRGLIQPIGPAELLKVAGSAQRLAVVFGNEAAGLSNDELRECQATLHLPTFSDYTSFNLSHAVAITLFALRLGEDERPSGAQPAGQMNAPATRGELAELAEAWVDALDRFGYFRRTHRRRFEPKLRAMLGRLRPARHDAGLLRGMIAHFSLFAPAEPDLPDP